LQLHCILAYQTVESYLMKTVIFSLLLGLGVISNAMAAGDVDAGKNKSAACAACHGVTGHNASPNFPNLAGQHADYIVKQLKAFKDGDRKDAMMAPMVANLSAQDMADLGAYFASQDRNGETAAQDSNGNDSAVVAVAEAHIPDALAGKGLYELGDASRNIGACIGCHGKEGNSEVLIYPNLAKQHSAYIEKQLGDFKSKARIDVVMNQFAGAMTANDIADMGAYFADTKAVAHLKAKKVVVALASASEIKAGETKAAMCVACHGVKGNSGIAIYPKLAGQNAAYIAKQLADFKAAALSGGKEGRNDPVMNGMAQGLSEQDMIDLGNYFSAQTAPKATGEVNTLGRKLYFGGDAKRGITACVACHGVDGKGMGQAAFPAVAGQHVEYLTAQIAKFRSKERNNDKSSMMRKISKKLKTKDIEALTQYMSSL
jgi:cytochrome c553